MSVREHRIDVAVFGGTATILVAGKAPDGTSAPLAATRAAALLRRIHLTLTRFDPESELSRLNADPRIAVPASPLLRRLARAVRQAGELSGGLVDGTVLPELVAAGYGASRAGDPRLPADMLRAAPVTGRPAEPDPRARWRKVAVVGEVLVRPRGVELDGGGLVKGMACDLVADLLEDHPLFGIDCSGDLRLGGTARADRDVFVEDPFDGEPAVHWRLPSGAVATSGVRNRSWLGPDGRVRHHLIDPARGVPAETDVVQATALAPTALEAEVRAKAALLSGSAAGDGHLGHGGLLITRDGSLTEHPPHEARLAA